MMDIDLDSIIAQLLLILSIYQELHLVGCQGDLIVSLRRAALEVGLHKRLKVVNPRDYCNPGLRDATKLRIYACKLACATSEFLS